MDLGKGQEVQGIGKRFFHVFSIFVMGICRSLWRSMGRDDRSTENTLRQSLSEISAGIVRVS